MTTAQQEATTGTPVIAEHDVTVYQGDVREQLALLPASSVQCVVTSPPYYGLRDYGCDGQLGLEASPGEYVEAMRAVFADVRRVLADDGVLWLNLGDSYVSKPCGNVRGVSDATGLHGGRTSDAYRDRLAAGHAQKRDNTRFGLPEKNLIGAPWRVALALQDDGWILRSEVIWHKLSGMPESITDRPSKRHEHIFMLAKSPRYYFDLDAIREPAVTTRESALSWDRDAKMAAVPGQRPQHRPGRTQRIRAEQIARDKGLTERHLEAIRACGVTDTGKAVVLQTGAGKNRAEIQALADEAKAALGGYYREFLTPDGGKNPGDVWSISTQPFSGAHFATMPPELARRCILAGCPADGTVLDPFAGSGTTLKVARSLGRNSIGIELNPDYIDIIRDRIGQTPLDFGEAVS